MGWEGKYLFLDAAPEHGAVTAREIRPPDTCEENGIADTCNTILCTVKNAGIRGMSRRVTHLKRHVGICLQRDDLSVGEGLYI